MQTRVYCIKFGKWWCISCDPDGIIWPNIESKICRHSLSQNRRRRLPKTKHLNSPFHRSSDSYSMAPVPKYGFLDIKLIKKFLSCLGVIPGQDIWDFGWTMWHWDWITTGICFHRYCHCTQYYTLPFNYFWRYIIWIIDGFVARHV